MKICISINTTTFKQLDEIMLERKKSTQKIFSESINATWSVLCCPSKRVEREKSRKRRRKSWTAKGKSGEKEKKKREDYWSRIQIRKFFFTLNLISTWSTVTSLSKAFHFFVYWEEKYLFSKFGTVVDLRIS